MWDELLGIFRVLEVHLQDRDWKEKSTLSEKALHAPSLKETQGSK